MKYKLIYHDEDNDTSTVGVCETYDESVQKAYDFINDEFGDSRGSFQYDSADDVLISLKERGYYIVGYGPESIEIEEV